MKRSLSQETVAGNAVRVANGVTGESGCQPKPVTILKVLTPVTPFGHCVTSLRSRLLFKTGHLRSRLLFFGGHELLRWWQQ